jgi:hypothetical protein
LEQELGARERLEPERHPRGTQVSIFFFVFILFVCLQSYAAQHTQRCSAAPQAAFASSSFLCNARSCKEEGDGNCRRLLLHVVELLQRCNAVLCCGAAITQPHAAELL